VSSRSRLQFLRRTSIPITREPTRSSASIPTRVSSESRAIAVGNRTWTAKGGLAVFAHQASSNPYYGRIGMELLAAGLSPEESLDRLVKSDDMSARRQVAVIDIHGRTAAHTGSGNLSRCGCRDRCFGRGTIRLRRGGYGLCPEGRVFVGC